MSDNRIVCADCQHYRGTSCTVARRRERVDVAREYSPVPNDPHRCIFFQPGADAEDKRTGAERYPDMVEFYQVDYGKRRTGKEQAALAKRVLEG